MTRESGSSGLRPSTRPVFVRFLSPDHNEGILAYPDQSLDPSALSSSGGLWHTGPLSKIHFHSGTVRAGLRDGFVFGKDFMKKPVPMPVLSDTMKTGLLSSWNKLPGDRVRAGKSLATIESDKAVMEIGAETDGFLSGPLAPVGRDIPVGATIAFLCDRKEECQESQGEEITPELVFPAFRPAHAPPPVPEKGKDNNAPGPGRESQGLVPPSPLSRPLTSPYARGLARELGVDLGSLLPGPDNVIHARMVLNAVLGKKDPDLSFSPSHQLRNPTGMESAVARNMDLSRGIPVFHLSGQGDLDPLRKATKKAGLSMTVILARALALSVLEHPRFNSLWIRGGILVREQVDVGVAVDTGEGLVTPVIRNAAKRPIGDMGEDFRILREKSLLGRLVPENYAGGTIFLSNLGNFPGVISFDAILPSTASAILAVSAPGDTGKNTLTLTCDHRMIYGAHAARFMDTFLRLIAGPDRWLENPP